MECEKCGTQKVKKKIWALSDFKVTSTYSFQLGEKPDWERQLNILKYVFERNGHAIKKLEIVAILRDWSASKVGAGNYPNSPVVVVDVPIWTAAAAEAYITSRIALHQEAEGLPPQELPDCTPEERWERPTVYAVKKEGGKQAYRVFESRRGADVEAQKRMMIVEVRPGENVRCERFCRAKPWCEQYKKLKGAAHD